MMISDESLMKIFNNCKEPFPMNNNIMFSDFTRLPKNGPTDTKEKT